MSRSILQLYEYFFLIPPQKSVGGKALLPVIRSICQAELGCDNVPWEGEERLYL
jgi:hypothetical protein